MKVAVRLLVACGIAIGLSVAASPAVAALGGEQAVPAVELSEAEVKLDDVIDVKITGFKSRTVTVTVCGNRALRGSGDCNMAASESTRVNEDGSPRYVRLVVSPPPVPCPCLVRVSSPTNDEAASATITLTGHPISALVSGAKPGLPLAVSIRANRATAGLDSIRASLGGPTPYDVTITIRNTATEAVAGISVAATAGRRQGHVLAVVDVVAPASIAAGATWEDTVRVELPAPVWGEVRWSVDIGGADDAVEATDDTSSIPVLLLAAIGVLLLVAIALSVRLVLRVRARRRAERVDHGSADVTGSDIGAVTDGGETPDRPWFAAREFEKV